MKKAFLAGAAILAIGAASVEDARAQYRSGIHRGGGHGGFYRGGGGGYGGIYRGGYGRYGGYYGYRRGGWGGGGAVAAGLIGGAILGGLVSNAYAQPYYGGYGYAAPVTYAAPVYPAYDYGYAAPVTYGYAQPYYAPPVVRTRVVYRAAPRYYRRAYYAPPVVRTRVVYRAAPRYDRRASYGRPVYRGVRSARVVRYRAY
jgi:hypothetical protein